MKEVTVNKEELLEKLRANRAKHRAVFLEAQEGYRKAVIAELDRMLQEARDGKKIRRRIELPEPRDHTDDYDAAIAMVEMAVCESIVISDYDFRCYVLDKWDWSETFSSSSSSYCSSSSDSSQEEE